MKRLITIALICIGAATTAAADTVTGQVSIYRTHTENHSVVNVRQYISFKIEGATLAAPCSWLFVGPNDSSTAAALLAAKIANRDITVHYTPTNLSSWSASVCAVIAVDL